MKTVILQYKINCLRDFALTLNEGKCNEIFGGLGHHLWTKFYVDCHHDFLLWWGYLDLDNRAKLAAYLER